MSTTTISISSHDAVLLQRFLVALAKYEINLVTTIWNYVFIDVKTAHSDDVLVQYSPNNWYQRKRNLKMIVPPIKYFYFVENNDTIDIVPFYKELVNPNIKNHCFMDSKNLTHVVLPDTITDIRIVFFWLPFANIYCAS